MLGSPAWQQLDTTRHQFYLGVGEPGPKQFHLRHPQPHLQVGGVIMRVDRNIVNGYWHTSIDIDWDACVNSPALRKPKNPKQIAAHGILSIPKLDCDQWWICSKICGVMRGLLSPSVETDTRLWLDYHHVWRQASMTRLSSCVETGVDD